jgi:DNA-binding NarL/FixJ family response regulator
MIRVLLVDEHPAVRAGLEAVMRAEPDLVSVGAAVDASEALAAVARWRPDVAVVDYGLPGRNGLLLCQRLRASTAGRPRVVLYSGHDPADLALPARLAGAHGVVGKAADVDELLDALRTAGSGGRVLPAIPARALEQLGARLEAVELPILGLAMNGVPPAEMAAVLRLSEHEVRGRLRRIITMLAAGLDGRPGARLAAGSHRRADGRDGARMTPARRRRPPTGRTRAV